MTVLELIRALRKMPPGEKVVFCDHDHNDEAGEHNAPPRVVELAHPTMRKLHGYGVVIRP